MNRYSIPVQIRWADIDQNRHVKHSAYYDYGAMARIRFFNDHDLTSARLESLKIGPVIFREEAVFRREIRIEDIIEIDVELAKATPDASRWTFRHEVTKADGTLAAVLTLDGAWVHMEKRKLTAPGNFVKSVFDAMPKSKDFQWLQTAETNG